MTPIELHPLTPPAPTTPVHRVEPAGDSRREPRRRPPSPGQRAAPEPDTVDADGHIDTHV